MAADLPGVGARPAAAGTSDAWRPAPRQNTEPMKEALMEAIGQTLVNFLGSGATWLVRLFLAVLVLALGWFIAKVVSKIVRQILQTANFDMRLGRWLTLDADKEEQEKPKRQIAGVIEAIVYYLLLVIFVIFALEVLGDKTITMVLQNILNEMGGAVPKILKALLVLAGAWLIALVVKFAVIKILRSIQFSERFEKAMKAGAEEGKKPRRDVAESFGNFLFYFILLFALLPFLDALQLTALVDPLKTMFAKVLGYAPERHYGRGRARPRLFPCAHLRAHQHELRAGGRH